MPDVYGIMSVDYIDERLRESCEMTRDGQLRKKLLMLGRTYAEELPRTTPMNVNSKGDSGRILVSIVSHHPVSIAAFIGVDSRHSRATELVPHGVHFVGTIQQTPRKFGSPTQWVRA